MIRIRLLSFLLLCSYFSHSQINESFTDGDFSVNPVWTGNIADWIVNPANQLQSYNPVANSTFYISTQNTLATIAQWEFFVRLEFNTSSTNYIDIFPVASAGDLTLSSTTGYFIRIGNTQDEIALYRKDAGGTIIKIIDGADGITNLSDNSLKIKLIRDAVSQFTLFRDDTGTGNNYISEGSATDATYTNSSFFGFLVKQSTSSFFQKHFFDDITIQTYVPDQDPPSIQTVTALSANTLDVLFSEPVDLGSSQTSSNYAVNNGISSPVSVQRDVANNALVHLNFTGSFSNGIVHTITINGVKDISGNVITNGMATFSFYIPQQFDIVIDEIMADPSPQVLLPNAEFIELKNISGKTINLSGWKLTTPSASSGAFPNYSLPADSFLILTSTGNALLYTGYGRVLGIASFPSLPNDGSLLTLISKEGRTIHALNYTPDWFQNAVKVDGGWSLEMIDIHNPCTGMKNWKASIDPAGGTPGKKNSVDGNNNDQTLPQLIRTYSIDSVTIVAIFDESLDSTTSSVNSNYSLNNNLTVISASPLSPMFTQVVLKLAAPMQKRTVYTLTINNVKDCKANTIGIYNKAKTGLSEEALAADIVVNEILFNPHPGSSDYIELYNRSNKVIDAGQLYIANRNSAGAISSIKKLSETPYSLFPDEYLVITEDATSLQNEYLVQNPNNVLVLTSLPSYPDDKGIVVITNSQGNVVDEVTYSDKWHFALISNVEGVAIERIDPAGSSQDPANWHSAASTAGYGTPTYKNSQFKQANSINAIIEISPKIFSPDNDGNDDFALINYQVEESGYVANITIFDANGRLVRYFVKNALLGLKGSWNWDGLGEKSQKLPIGTYIIFTEIFNLQGKKKQFKNTVVLARRLN